MKRINRYIGLVMLVVLLGLVSCKDQTTLGTDTPGEESCPPAPVTDRVTEPGDGAATDPSSDTAWEPSETQVFETEATEAEPPVELVARTMTAVDFGVELELSIAIRETSRAWTLTLSLSDNAGVIAEQTVTATSGQGSYKLDCPAARLAGELTLTAQAIAGDVVGSEITLRMNNKLPQLTADGVRCVVAAMTLEEKAHMVTGVKDPVKPGASGGTYPIDRLGVPSITVNDGPAGVRYGTAVWYPSIINVSSSWDTALAERIGQSIGEDALALGIDVVLAPGMNIQKNVLGGRNFEYSSEDPILTALMVAPYVRGMQSTGVGTSIKHYAVNNQETARGGISANVTERALREIYLKGFGMVVESADPWTVMSSYNSLNGVATSTSRELLTDILRGEFGFEGMVMSDWGSQGTVDAKVNAGNDINMPGEEGDPEVIIRAYNNGTLDKTALDAACFNILRLVTRSATFNGLEMNTHVDTSAHHALATNEAADTMILLRNNEATLPLGQGTTVAVFGNGSIQTVYGGAGSGSVAASKTISILEGLRRCSSIEVVNVKNNPFLNCPAHSEKDPSMDVEVTEVYAREMAEAAKVAIVVISRGSTEGEDHSTLQGDFQLNDTERTMLERISEAFHAKGGRVIVLLNTGTPMEVVSWRDLTDAILWVGYAGQGTGTAVGRVLTGEVNPSGKTTITWPTTYHATPASEYFPGNAYDTTYYEDIYVGYRYYSTFGVDVAYPFGYGLSYTDFAYEQFTVQRAADGTLWGIVTVKNTGKVAGREVVQIYVSKPETTQEQAARELAGFGKTALLEPGATETLFIRLSDEALWTYVTEDSKWIIDQGDYTFSVAASSEDIRATVIMAVAEAMVTRDVENRCVPDTTFDYIRKADYTVPDLTMPSTNLALGKPAISNYDENADYGPQFACDGDRITRWSGLGLSSGSAHIWEVDLGEVYKLGKLNIYWESIHAPYTILLSSDGKTFTRFASYVDDGSMRLNTNLYGAEARYIRVEILRGNHAVSMFEFEVLVATDADVEAGREEENKRENMALGKPIEATEQEGNYKPANAADGDLTTRWGSLPNGEAWLTVNLEEIRQVTEIEVYLESAWVPFVVEYSIDGKAYTELARYPADTLLVVLDDLDIDAKFIRLRRDGENWFSIYEVFVYGP